MKQVKDRTVYNVNFIFCAICLYLYYEKYHFRGWLFNYIPHELTFANELFHHCGNLISEKLQSSGRFFH